MSSPPLFLLTPDNPFPPIRHGVAPFQRRKAFLYALICLLWLFFGIFGRDPWKPEETLLTAAIADTLRPAALELNSAPAGSTPADTLQQSRLAERPPFYLLLTTATAALTAGFLPLHEGARLANILLLIGGFICLWLAAAIHYGRRTGWLTLLLVIGCFGFIVRAHQLNFGIAAFFGMALALTGAAILSDKRRYVNQALLGGGLIGLSSLFLLFSYSLFAALIALTALLPARKEQIAAYLSAAVFFMPALAIAWVGDTPLALTTTFSITRLPSIIGDALRVATWSLLPLLPLAAYGLWYTRRRRLELLPRVCLLAIAAGFVSVLLNEQHEEDYYLLLPPLALLAAHLLMKIPDDVASVMDFFALLIIGLCVVSSLWGVWLVASWELPPLNALLQEQLPGYTLPPSPAWKVIAAALLTIGWIALLCNFGRSKERAVVNWSCGVTLVWSVFNLLLVGYVDSGKSYRQAAGDVRQAVGTDCVSVPDMKHWRAQLAYFGVSLGGEECPYYLSSSDSSEALLRVRRNAGETGYYLHRRI